MVYFTAYFGMYLYLPVINKGISLLTKSEFKLVVISISFQWSVINKLFVLIIYHETIYLNIKKLIFPYHK